MDVAGGGGRSRNAGTIRLDHSTLVYGNNSDRTSAGDLGTVRAVAAVVRSDYVSMSVPTGATFSGTATVYGSLSIGGTLAPGDPTGTIAVLPAIDVPAGVTLLADARFDVDLGPGGAVGQLTVDGVLDLGAADNFLDLSMLPGALSGTPYAIATAASVVGTFEHVTPGFTVQYTPTSVIVTAVPEPTVGLLLGVAAVVMPSRGRCRR